ncbi:hypothetical protein ACOMHN_011359 [Nucella lapillus]
MASGDMEQLQLRRYDTSQSWGFRMQGGSEFNMPLYVAQVSPKSIADKAGARNGDGILEICGSSTQGWSHAQAKQAMIRAGNEVDLAIQRGMVSAQDMPAQAPDDKRVELDEDSIDPHMNEGSKFRNVMPKSYRMLEQQLAGGDPLPSSGRKRPPLLHLPLRLRLRRLLLPVVAESKEQFLAFSVAGPKPASIFDRKKQDRSDYLQAQGQTIQKAYGQNN